MNIKAIDLLVDLFIRDFMSENKSYTARDLINIWYPQRFKGDQNDPIVQKHKIYIEERLKQRFLNKSGEDYLLELDNLRWLISEEENEANAKRMAAAHDLLEISNELFLKMKSDSHCVNKYASELIDLHKAIKKATE